jgi:hypothetical protein
MGTRPPFAAAPVTSDCRLARLTWPVGA